MTAAVGAMRSSAAALDVDDLDDPRIPAACPLPRDELLAWLADSGEPGEPVCACCEFGLVAIAMSSRARLIFAACSALGPEPRLVAVIPAESGRAADADRQVLELLRRGERSAAAIREAIGGSRHVVARSLGRLRDAGLIGADVELRR